MESLVVFVVVVVVVFVVVVVVFVLLLLLLLLLLSEPRRCVNVEVVVLGYQTLIVLMVSVDVKQN